MKMIIGQEKRVKEAKEMEKQQSEKLHIFNDVNIRNRQKEKVARLF